MFDFKSLLMKTVCFKAMKTKYQRSMDLCLKLHRATYQIDTKQCQSAFDMIREFQNAKKAVYRTQQNYSLKDLVSVLHTMHQKRMYRYLSDLRELIYSDKERCAKIKNLFSHFGDSAGTRNYFNRWKNQAKKAETVQEVNEAGPIVEEVLDA